MLLLLVRRVDSIRGSWFGFLEAGGRDEGGITGGLSDDRMRRGVGSGAGRTTGRIPSPRPCSARLLLDQFPAVGHRTVPARGLSLPPMGC